MEDVVDALNSDFDRYDFMKVVPLIPKDWYLSALVPFLTNGLRTIEHKRMKSGAERALLRIQNHKVAAQYVNVRSQGLIVSKQSKCDLCNIGFTEVDYVWFPIQRLLAHRHCFSNRNSIQ